MATFEQGAFLARAAVGAIGAQRADVVERIGSSIVALAISGRGTAVVTQADFAGYVIRSFVEDTWTAVGAIAAKRTEVAERIGSSIVTLAITGRSARVLAQDFLRGHIKGEEQK